MSCIPLDPGALLAEFRCYDTVQEERLSATTVYSSGDLNTGIFPANVPVTLFAVNIIDYEPDNSVT